MNKRTFLKTVAVGGMAAGAGLLRGQTGSTVASRRGVPRRHIATTEGAAWQDHAMPLPAAASERPDLVITDETSIAWRGFGGCFNELGWRALQHLSALDLDAVFDRLFHPKGDLQLEHCRIPIGGNDYSEDWYSLDDTPGDFELAHFSIERDRRALVPYVRAALARQPNLSFFASPWSPPTWMKQPPVYNGGRLINTPQNLEAYARYLAKFVAAYASEGIKVGQLHVQNEPTSAQKFPSCVMTGEELRDFIAHHLGPAFKRVGCDAEIWLGTINGPEGDFRTFHQGFNDYAFTVLEDPEARRFVRGISYQWGGKFAVWRTRLAYPELPLTQSENECGDGTNSWRYAWYIADLFHHYLAQDVSAYCYWNMVLEPRGESTWGWAQNSLLTVDPVTRRMTVNPEYHVLRHYSAFIRRGDRRRQCSGPWAANAVAFMATDRGTAAVVRNPFAEPRTVTITCDGGTWRAELPALSLNTILL
jgi:glucosylceramidase